MGKEEVEGVPLGGGRRCRLCYCFRSLHWGIARWTRLRVDVRVLQIPPWIVSDLDHYMMSSMIADGLQSSQSRGEWASMRVEAALLARWRSTGDPASRHFETQLCSIWKLLKAEDSVAL